MTMKNTKLSKQICINLNIGHLERWTDLQWIQFNWIDLLLPNREKKKFFFHNYFQFTLSRKCVNQHFVSCSSLLNSIQNVHNSQSGVFIESQDVISLRSDVLNIESTYLLICYYGFHWNRFKPKICLQTGTRDWRYK